MSHPYVSGQRENYIHRERTRGGINPNLNRTKLNVNINGEIISLQYGCVYCCIIIV